MQEKATDYQVKIYLEAGVSGSLVSNVQKTTADCDVINLIRYMFLLS